jgi:hypothetical protein
MLAGVGAPYLNVLPMLTPGKVFFVHATLGKTNNTGDDPTRPMTTIQAAYNKCRATRGDMVVALPGHTEAISAAAGIVLNLAGVRVIGIGDGNARPVLTLGTATSASFDITAANNLVSGFVFDMTGVDAITAGMNVQAADTLIVNNRFILASASAQATLGILTTAAANRMTLMANRFEGTSDAGTTAAVRIVGGDGITIGGLDLSQGNWFYGAYSSGVGAIQGLTTDTTNILVASNAISNVTANSTKAMVFTASSTGVFTNNRMAILSGTAPVTFAAGNNGGGGYYSAAAGVAAGTLI